MGAGAAQCKGFCKTDTINSTAKARATGSCDCILLIQCAIARGTFRRNNVAAVIASVAHASCFRISRHIRTRTMTQYQPGIQTQGRIDQELVVCVSHKVDNPSDSDRQVLLTSATIVFKSSAVATAYTLVILPLADAILRNCVRWRVQS
jgi:hypothetical protein